MNWHKVRAVASFEFVTTLKRKGYLIATFGMPLFVLAYGGVIGIIGKFMTSKVAEIKMYGVMDRAGILGLDGDVSRAAREMPEEIRAALERMEERSPMPAGMDWWEEFVFRPFDEHEAARQALLDRDISAYYVFPEDFLSTGHVEFYALDGLVFSGSDARQALEGMLQDRLLAGKASQEEMKRIRDPISGADKWTVLPDGQLQKRELATQIVRLVVPIAFTILLFISLMISAGYLLQGTAVEKENKVVEVILSSANPDEVLAGKLLGLAGAGLLQVGIWFGMVLATGLITAGALEVAGVDVPWFSMVAGILFFLIGYIFLGSLMLGTGSLGSNQRESQQLSMVWSLLTVAPLMFLQILMFEPHGTLARILTWIPFTAPVTNMFRMTLEPEGLHWWEPVGSFLVLVLATWFALRFGARLFRVGLLLTGARPKFREILRQARLKA